MCRAKFGSLFSPEKILHIYIKQIINRIEIMTFVLLVTLRRQLDCHIQDRK